MLKSIALLVLLAALLTGCNKTENTGSGRLSQPQPGGTLKVGIIPFDDVDTIKTGFTPFAQYLAHKCGYAQGEVFITPEYSGVLQAMHADQIDCAYLNPLSYVLAVQNFKDSPEKLMPLAMPYFHGSLTYRGDIFVRADSGINTLADFKGKTFAFGDVTSTSGYLYPAGMMKAAGLDPEKDVRKVNITGLGPVLPVFNKIADGGATYEGGIARALKDPARRAQIKILAKTDPIPNGMLVARGNLDPQTLAKLQKALQDINTDPEGKAALKAVPSGGWDKIVPADDAIFNPVREKATILGLNLQSLDKPKQ